MNTPQPARLSLWDRLFNRYIKIVHVRGNESWAKYQYGVKIYDYNRDWVDYKVVDRVTGSENITREYLN